MELLTEDVMTEASLLTEECRTSHKGSVTPVTAATHQQVQSDQVGTCDHTATSEAGSGVMQFRVGVFAISSSTIESAM